MKYFIKTNNKISVAFAIISLLYQRRTVGGSGYMHVDHKPLINSIRLFRKDWRLTEEMYGEQSNIHFKLHESGHCYECLATPHQNGKELTLDSFLKLMAKALKE